MSSDVTATDPAPFVAEHARQRWSERVPQAKGSLIQAWERGQRLSRLPREFGVDEVRVDRVSETLILRRKLAIVSVLRLSEISRKESDVVTAAIDLEGDTETNSGDRHE
ncbi:hypothetical protein [Halalkalicoccus sp. NIPERK01]|uniref:hypothetical protein n=1 Tax=Halalkalicoccus sp. NIPERK01 TaxID=3053469 RepID=UPI00256EAF6E|nr:hypothetical protein [Halalkalicoccus sp. NIPERK01]MDL5361314.1 hypothetical protein [Halalkalicoccus sp. NIPERK01]